MPKDFNPDVKRLRSLLKEGALSWSELRTRAEYPRFIVRIPLRRSREKMDNSYDTQDLALLDLAESKGEGNLFSDTAEDSKIEAWHVLKFYRAEANNSGGRIVTLRCIHPTSADSFTIQIVERSLLDQNAMVIGRTGILDIVLKTIKQQTGLGELYIRDLAELSFDHVRILDDLNVRAKGIDSLAKILRRMNKGESVNQGEADRLAECLNIAPQDLYFDVPNLYKTTTDTERRRNRKLRTIDEIRTFGSRVVRYRPLTRQLVQQELEALIVDPSTRIVFAPIDDFASDKALVRAYSSFRDALLALDHRVSHLNRTLTKALDELRLKHLEAWCGWNELRERLTAEGLAELPVQPETDIIEYTLVSIAVTKQGGKPKESLVDQSSVRILKRPNAGL